MEKIEMTECAYCGHEAPVGSPQGWDNYDWEAEIPYHAADCEWILTHAHGLMLEHDTEAVLIHGSTGQPIEHDILPAGTCYSLESTDAPSGPKTCIQAKGYRYEVDSAAL